MPQWMKDGKLISLKKAISANAEIIRIPEIGPIVDAV
jgi:hypothetical protein